MPKPLASIVLCNIIVAKQQIHGILDAALNTDVGSCAPIEVATSGIGTTTFDRGSLLSLLRYQTFH
jgi:hypothetical protein